MARITIEDLPEDRELSSEDLEEVAGGLTLSTATFTSTTAPRYIGLDPMLSRFGSVSASSCGVCGVRG